MFRLPQCLTYNRMIANEIKFIMALQYIQIKWRQITHNNVIKKTIRGETYIMLYSLVDVGMQSTVSSSIELRPHFGWSRKFPPKQQQMRVVSEWASATVAFSIRRSMLWIICAFRGSVGPIVWPTGVSRIWCPIPAEGSISSFLWLTTLYIQIIK